MTGARVEVFDGEFAVAAAERIAGIIAAQVTTGGRAAVALSGGSTPAPVYRRLVRHSLPMASLSWWFSDERAVDRQAPTSNFGMAQESLFVPAVAPRSSIHRIRGELGAGAAARDYEERLVERLGLPPRLDLALLGVGADGHTASLFSSDDLELPGWAVATRAPAEPRSRISLSTATLACCPRLVLLVAGSAKREVVRSIAAGGSGTVAEAVTSGRAGVLWLLDRQAAGIS